MAANRQGQGQQPLVIYFQERATSRIKSSHWVLQIRYRSQIPKNSQDQSQPMLLGQAVPDNIAAPTYPEKVLGPKLLPKLLHEQFFAPSSLDNLHFSDPWVEGAWLSTVVQYTAVFQASRWRQGCVQFRLKWSDTISHIIEAENEKMTPSPYCCSISISKNTLLFSRSYLSQPGQV